MGEAVVFGLIASSALVIGGAVGAYVAVPATISGVLLAFASGSLISALCFELFPDAFELGGATRAGLGLLAGGATFVLANTWLDRRVAGSAKKQQTEKVADAADSADGDGLPATGGAVGFALLAAVTLDGAQGRPGTYAIAIWSICGLVLALAVVLGRAALSGAGEATLSVCLAFAGGAVLASLADTLMPEAFEHGRPWNSFATGVGFFLSFMLARA